MAIKMEREKKRTVGLLFSRHDEDIMLVMCLCDTGGHVHARAGSRQSVVRRSLTGVHGLCFTAAASFDAVRQHAGSDCETSRRSDSFI